MIEELDSSRKEPSITFPPMKAGIVHVKEEREKVSPVSSYSNAEPGYSIKTQNEDLINSISALINTRLNDFRSEMFTLINKNGDQPMSLGDRDSYYEDFEANNLPKGEKGKTGDTQSDELSALFKDSAENHNNGAVVGLKRPITNNDGSSNTPAKVPCFQNPAKIVSDVEVDLEILNQVDQEHQIPQNLGDAISERLTSVIKKHWSYEPEKFGSIKKLHEKLLIPQNYREICTPKLNREIFCNNNIPGWVKRADKRSQNCQASVVKATAGMIKLCDNLLKAEKQNYIVNIKDLLSLAMESIMLLGHVNFPMNNMRRDRIKNSLQKGLHFLCEAGNPPTTLLLGDDLPKKIREAKESSKLTSHPLSQPLRYTGYQNQKGGSQAKNNFLSQDNKHRARYRPQYQNNRQYRN